MTPLLLVLSWLLCALVGFEIGGRLTGWMAMQAVPLAGVEWEFEHAMQQLSDPEIWRDR